MDPTGMERRIATLPAIVENTTLPKTNTAPEKLPSQKERIVFQPSIFRCKLAVSFRGKKKQKSFFNHFPIWTFDIALRIQTHS